MNKVSCYSTSAQNMYIYGGTLCDLLLSTLIKHAQPSNAHFAYSFAGSVLGSVVGSTDGSIVGSSLGTIKLGSMEGSALGSMVGSADGSVV